MNRKTSFPHKPQFLIVLCLTIVLLGSVTIASSQAQQPTRRVPDRPAGGGAGTDAITPATAEELAAAMGVPATDLISADLMGSDPAGVGVSDAPLGYAGFPISGGTFAILSTGLAADASRPNDSGSQTTVLGGLDNNQGNDLVRLHLELQVPSEFDCVAFDLALYSEEFPEWVSSQYNDTFTAQLNNQLLEIDEDNQVVAPDNFAFDSQGNMMSINTIFGVSPDTGTTYDGGTARIQAHTTVVPNSTINIYLSIQDVGDPLYDSAVFLDNFFWSRDPNCESGASVDSDNDGLLDEWEMYGLTVMVGGEDRYVNLPAMGANPMHKDVFVEIDYMAGSHSHRPNDMAISKIVQSFNNATVGNPDGMPGIHLHVDYGPTAPLTWGAGGTWGSLSRSSAFVHHLDYISSTCTGTLAEPAFPWSGFDNYKTVGFGAERASVFHYSLWAHKLCPELGDRTGNSRNAASMAHGDGASDFIVTLGGTSSRIGTVNEQAGTFMHELGHNLGLYHGGADDINHKPNYLSVMNYSFQTRGLTINGITGNFDYSRYNLPDLSELDLDEPSGLRIPGTVTDRLGTRYFCWVTWQTDDDARAVDWNCNGRESDNDVLLNINYDTVLSTLTSQNDWRNLVYLGGAIGRLGAAVEMPMESVVNELTVYEDAMLDATPQVYIPLVNR